MSHLFVFLNQVLALAAQELSKPITEQRTPSIGVVVGGDLTPYPGDNPVHWRQVVEKRIQSKTKRLSKVIKVDILSFLVFMRSLELFSNFLCASGRHSTSSQGHPEPLRSCCWTLLFPSAQQLWQVSMLFSVNLKAKHFIKMLRLNLILFCQASGYLWPVGWRPSRTGQVDPHFGPLHASGSECTGNLIHATCDMISM